MRHVIILFVAITLVWLFAGLHLAFGNLWLLIVFSVLTILTVRTTSAWKLLYQPEVERSARNLPTLHFDLAGFRSFLMSLFLCPLSSWSYMTVHVLARLPWHLSAVFWLRLFVYSFVCFAFFVSLSVLSDCFFVAEYAVYPASVRLFVCLCWLFCLFVWSFVAWYA